MNRRRSTNKQQLQQYLQDRSENLWRTLRVYVLRAGLGDETTSATVASELLNDVAVEALQHPERYSPSRPPKAWLLGIAANLIRRKQVELQRLHHREPLLRDLYAEDVESDDELFDRMCSISDSDPAHTVEQNEQLSLLLEGLSPGDKHILKSAILHDMDGDTLSRELNISPGAARVRLHRALRRLRAINQLLKEANNGQQ
jgi:RNA polymerase sigma factor (sigma-70 family)